MNYKPYPAVTRQTYESMVKQWIEAVLNHESGTWIWAPLIAPYRRIWDFQNDTELQKRLLGGSYSKHIFIHVDLEQRENITKNELYNLIVEQLHAKKINNSNRSNTILSSINDLTEKKKKRLVIFVTGVDTAIKKNQWLIVEELNYLAQTSWNLSILFFTEVDITSHSYFQQFCKSTTLAQNITILPLYSKEDTETFVKYLCSNWKVKLAKEQIAWIYKNCGGHYLLTKDVIRIIRKSGQISIEEIENFPSLILRAKAIISSLLPEQVKIIDLVIRNKPLNQSLSHTKDFLVKQGLLHRNNEKFELTIPYLEKFIVVDSEQKPNSSSEILLFTAQESKIYDLLKNSLSKLTTREEVAKLMWSVDWENYYSDWAIDQMIHRLREKIKKARAPYKLLTKKGEGFILLQK